MRSGIHYVLRLPCQPLLLAAGLVILSADCGLGQPTSTPDQQRCTAAEAHSAVGQPYSSALAEQARRAAGAREVRKIEPRGAYTTDLDAARLNVEVDRTGVVTGLRCG
jgi:hypothetical protein